jgi:hypothetical protein
VFSSLVSSFLKTSSSLISKGCLASSSYLLKPKASALVLVTLSIKSLPAGGFNGYKLLY